MTAILSCPVDRNENFEVCVTSYKQGNIFMVANEYTEFLPLMCTVCRRITFIEKNAIKRDGSLWRYMK